jgi:hypothetical protein
MDRRWSFLDQVAQARVSFIWELIDEHPIMRCALKSTRGGRYGRRCGVD